MNLAASQRPSPDCRCDGKAWTVSVELFPSTSVEFLLCVSIAITLEHCQTCHLYSTHGIQFKTHCAAAYIPSPHKRLTSATKHTMHQTDVVTTWLTFLIWTSVPMFSHFKTSFFKPSVLSLNTWTLFSFSKPWSQLKSWLQMQLCVAMQLRKRKKKKSRNFYSCSNERPWCRWINNILTLYVPGGSL